MEPTPILPPIAEQVKEYLETKYKLLKYEGIDKASAVVAEVITDLIMVILLAVTFIFFSLTLALLAAHFLHSNWEGFGCITLLYLLIAFAIRSLKLRLQNVIIQKIIEKIFKIRNK